MKDWINLGALGVIGLTAVSSLVALGYKVDIRSVVEVAGPIVTGCFAIVNRGSVQ